MHVHMMFLVSNASLQEAGPARVAHTPARPTPNDARTDAARHLPPSRPGPQERGMKRECSWDAAAQQYEQIISWACMDPPFCNT